MQNATEQTKRITYGWLTKKPKELKTNIKTYSIQMNFLTPILEHQHTHNHAASLSAQSLGQSFPMLATHFRQDTPNAVRRELNSQRSLDHARETCLECTRKARTSCENCQRSESWDSAIPRHCQTLTKQKAQPQGQKHREFRAVTRQCRQS